MEYTPSETIRAFMMSEARIRALVGPLGGGKSMGALMELFRRMVGQEPDANGIRPTRFALVRNTAAQLRESLLKDSGAYFGSFFEHSVSTATLFFRFQMADGTRVESDWLLMPLDRPEDRRKLLSLNLTGALIDECREVPYEIVADVDGRIGRYPPPIRVRRTWRGIILVSNPWSVSTQYHENLVINRPPGWELYKQPGGLDPLAENRQFLDDDYYERLTEGRGQEWINVHVHGMWGEDLTGQAVYVSSFKDHHIRDKLIPTPLQPLLIGIDYGRNPAAIITQKDFTGRLVAHEEVIGESMGLATFLDQLLIPKLNDDYPDYRIFIVGDPAGVAKDDYSESSAYTILEERGFLAKPAPTNDPFRRVQAVEKRLVAKYGDGPDFLISREKCPVTVEGFYRGYKYRRMLNGEMNNSPEKNSFSHPHDALQYAALGHQNNFTAKVLMKSLAPRRFRPSAPDPRAWT